MEEKDKKAMPAELDLKQIASTLVRKSWIIIITSIVCAVVTFLGTYYFVTPQYQSSTKFYVNNGKVSIGDVGLSVSDLSAAQELVNSYIVILESRETLNAIIDYAGVDVGPMTLRAMISAAPVNATEIFQVVVTSPDPYQARDLAAAVAAVLPNRIGGIIEGTSAKVVENPVVSTSPSSPSYSRNAVLGFLVGALISTAAIFLYVVFDVTIRSEEDVQRICTHPVLASVPDMTARTKGGYYYTAGKKQPASSTSDKETGMVGSKISFAALEAYKLMRTKLQFSFVDDQDCHVIGVCSAMAGEGKSLTSANLAYTLAQLDKRVLLIDCDMRRPSLNVKLGIKKTPGLSNYLTRQVQQDEIIQKFGDEEASFDVISSGRNPPNPVELLSSARMETALKGFCQSYDYIILDLPPVEEVSDALVAAKIVDGVLLVVRQNFCNSHALSAAVKQFSFVDTRILGVVVNCATDRTGRYYKKRYRGYQNRYEGSYMAAAKSAKQDSKH